MALVQDRHYLLEKIKPNQHGYKERVTYTGSLRQKPKGWRVVREISRDCCSR